MLFNPLISIYEISIILVIILLIIYFVYKKMVKGKIVIFGFLWFIMYLLPTFFISENQILFHRLLLPSVGLIIVFSIIIQQILTKYSLIKKYFVFVWIIFFISYSFISFKQSDKYKNSENFYLNAYNDAPTYYKFIAEIGKMYLNLGEYDKALEYLYLAEHKCPNNYLEEIAIVLCYQNKIDEAEKLLNKSIAANKYKDFCYGNLSLIYENKKDYQKALEYALKAYEINSRNPDFFRKFSKDI